MSVIATAVKHLMAAGVTGEALLSAIAEMEEQVRGEPKERSAGAIRQERYRRNKASRVTQSDACDATPPLSRPPNENISNPPTHTSEKQTRARKGHRLPVDWEPQPLTGDTGTAVDGWPPGAQERELARFKDWAASASGPNAVKSDWQAAWRNWVRKAHDEGRYAKRDFQHSQSARLSIVDIGRNLAADMEREAQARAAY